MGALGDDDYRRLAAVRAGIREYLAWAETQAREHDMTPAQVQLALAIRAHPDPAGPTMTELARDLLLRHHSAVGLVDRAQAAGLVRRAPDPGHSSRVRVQLTREGAERLQTLAALHVRWLEERGPALSAMWSSFGR